jgi:site-specific DNA recombinase
MSLSEDSPVRLYKNIREFVQTLPGVWFLRIECDIIYIETENISVKGAEFMKKVIGYIRVSTEEQTRGYGLDVQREKIETYCNLYNLANLEIFSDNLTGKTLERPGLQRLLEEVRTGNVERIVVFKVDRFTRKLRDLLTLIEDELEPHNVAFVSVSEQFDTSTPTGKAFLQMLGTFAELERNTIVYRTTTGRLEKARQGGNAGGATPLGYVNVDGDLQKFDDEVEIVKAVFAMRADGLTYRAIAAILNQDGATTKRGGKWYASTVRYIAENPKYQGLNIYRFNVKEFGIDEKTQHTNPALAIGPLT